MFSRFVNKHFVQHLFFRQEIATLDTGNVSGVSECWLELMKLCKTSKADVGAITLKLKIFISSTDISKFKSPTPEDLLIKLKNIK